MDDFPAPQFPHKMSTSGGASLAAMQASTLLQQQQLHTNHTAVHRNRAPCWRQVLLEGCVTDTPLRGQRNENSPTLAERAWSLWCCQPGRGRQQASKGAVGVPCGLIKENTKQQVRPAARGDKGPPVRGCEVALKNLKLRRTAHDAVQARYLRECPARGRARRGAQALPDRLG